MEYTGYQKKSSKSVALNTSKVVTIQRADSVSWKQLLTKILSTQTTTVLGNGFTSLDVNENVELFMGQTAPTINVKTNMVRPIKSLFDGFGNVKIGNNNYNIGESISNVVNVGSALHQGYKRFVMNDPEAKAETAEVWNPWLNSVPTWESSSTGFTFEYKFSFALGQYGLWNAEEEVVKPLLNLFAPVLPREMTSFTSSGPIPHVLDLISKIGLSKDDNKNIKEKESNVLKQLGMLIEKAVMNAYQSFKYTVSFGNVVTFSQCLITGATINLSSQTDTNGFPVSGDITMRFETLVPIAMYANDSSLLSMRFGG